MNTMRNKRLFFLSIKLILCVFLLSNCKNSNRPLNEIDLTEISIAGDVDMSFIIDDIKYLPLETTENNLLGHITKLIISNDHIHVRDNRNLHLFSMDGSYVARIGDAGRGPGQYQFIKDFCVDNNSQEVFILDINAIKVHDFLGNYKYEITARTNHWQIELVNDNFLIYNENSSGNTEYSYELINKNGDVIEQFPNKYKFDPNGIFVFNQETINYYFNAKLHCREVHSDTVFIFKDNSFLPKYILHQGSGRISPEIRSNAMYLFESTDYINITHIFETDSYLFLSYFWKKIGYYIIMDKYNGEKSIFDSRIGLTNDIDGGPNFKPELYFTRNQTEYLVTWMNAFELIAHVESETFKNSTPKYPEKKKQLEELAASLDENDNPVLMLVKLKE